jgi:8-oxo-dGTP diphosphatase
MTTVVAGVLIREGKILVCQRRADQAHSLKWEFPGGKLEAGETPELALIRELREELGIEAEPARELMRYEYAYPGKNPILLMFFEVLAWRGEIVNLIFETMEWSEAERLKDYDLLEGDGPFLAAYRPAIVNGTPRA